MPKVTVLGVMANDDAVEGDETAGVEVAVAVGDTVTADFAAGVGVAAGGDEVGGVEEAVAGMVRFVCTRQVRLLEPCCA